MKETRRMLFIACDEGIQSKVATPHYDTRILKEEFESIFATYEQVVNITQEYLMEFHILLGTEVLYSQDIICA